MAFTDSPEVDESSKRSEESVALVKSILSRRNRFINREENPNYGVDLDVELVARNKSPLSRLHLKPPGLVTSAEGFQA
jgi:hypothetical protein